MNWQILSGALNTLSTAPRDPGAWEDLYRKLYPYLVASFYRAFRGNSEQAEEAAHETLIRLFKTFDFSRKEAERAFPSYVAKIIQSIIADRWKNAARERLVPLEGIDPADESPSPEEIRSWADSYAGLRSQLSANDRELLEMMLDGLKAPEISARFGLSDDATYQRIGRLRRRLRELLDA